MELMNKETLKGFMKNYDNVKAIAKYVSYKYTQALNIQLVQSEAMGIVEDYDLTKYNKLRATTKELRELSYYFVEIWDNAIKVKYFGV